MRLLITAGAIVAMSFSANMAASPFDGNTVRGEKVYKQRCIMCHGPDGRGQNGLAVNFFEEWYRLTKPDVELIDSIRNGKRTPGTTYGAGEMPPQALDDEQIRDVLAYIRQAFGTNNPEFMPGGGM